MSPGNPGISEGIETNRIARITIPLAILISALVVYLFFDLASDLKKNDRENQALKDELRSMAQRLENLNKSMLSCAVTAEMLVNESRDYYDKWQAERRISYSLWQMIDAATNITWEGQDVTQVNIIIPRSQWEYLLNLSRTYGLRYQWG